MEWGGKTSGDQDARSFLWHAHHGDCKVTGNKLGMPVRMNLVLLGNNSRVTDGVAVLKPNRSLLWGTGRLACYATRSFLAVIFHTTS